MVRAGSSQALSPTLRTEGTCVYGGVSIYETHGVKTLTSTQRYTIATAVVFLCDSTHLIVSSVTMTDSFDYIIAGYV